MSGPAADPVCDTIALVAPDLGGKLRTRHVPLGRFDPLATPRFADIVFAFDEVDRLIPRPAGFTGWWPEWAGGFGDLETRPDLSTRRPLGWRPGVDIVFADLHHASGDEVAVAPRQVLARVGRRLAGTDAAVVRVGTEIEFFLSDPGGPTDPAVVGDAYAFDPPVADRAALEAVVRCLLASGIDVDSWYAEGGVRQYEIALAPTDPVSAADAVLLTRQAVREIAVAHGLRASFRPKPGPGFGSGLHVHVSAYDERGHNLLRDIGAPTARAGASLLAGILAVLRPATAIFSPGPEGYLRLAPHTAAGTTATWARDHRGAGVRLLDRGDQTRCEIRCAASDANPYLVVSAILAGVVHGAGQRLTLPPESSGDIYEQATAASLLPTDLATAADLLAVDPVLTDLLGAELVAHHAATRRWVAGQDDASPPPVLG